MKIYNFLIKKNIQIFDFFGRLGNMKKGLSVSVILLVVYLLVQSAECENNRFVLYLTCDSHLYAKT